MMYWLIPYRQRGEIQRRVRDLFGVILPFEIEDIVHDELELQSLQTDLSQMKALLNGLGAMGRNTDGLAETILRAESQCITWKRQITGDSTLDEEALRFEPSRRANF
jgi:hypothetical protein